MVRLAGVVRLESCARPALSPRRTQTGWGRMSKHRPWRAIAAAATLVTGLTISAGTATAASGWTIQNTPSPGVSTADGVACPAANACVAVGHGSSQAEAWNGTTWTLEPVPIPAGAGGIELTGVACTSVDACTAVGYSARPFNTSTLVEAWNGTSWSIQSSPNPGGPGNDAELTGVSCTSASSCVAVGFYHPAVGPATDALAEVWDGSSCKIRQAVTPSGATYVALDGVSCTSTSNCIAVGSQDGSTLAERWDGKSWSMQSTASAPGIGNDGTLSSVDCTSANNCMAVGDVN